MLDIAPNSLAYPVHDEPLPLISYAGRTMNQWMFKNGVDISQSRKGGPKPAMKGLKENRKTARHAAPGGRMSAWASWSPTE
jgi:hypothetical protein